MHCRKRISHILGDHINAAGIANVIML